MSKLTINKIELEYMKMYLSKSKVDAFSMGKDIDAINLIADEDELVEFLNDSMTKLGKQRALTALRQQRHRTSHPSSTIKVSGAVLEEFNAVKSQYSGLSTDEFIRKLLLSVQE